jgi:hypothetical protein
LDEEANGEMNMEGATVQIEASGDNYVIENIMDGVKQSMTLSPADILKLAANAPKLQDQILGSLRRKGAEPNVHLQVAQISVDHTVHRDEIVMRITDRNQASMSYLITLQQALILAQGLTQRVAQLQQNRQNPQH